jgi:hypothetical protein
MNGIAHRSALYSSLIGAAGAIVAAFIIAHGQREIDELHSAVAQRDATIMDLTGKLNACAPGAGEIASSALKTKIADLESQLGKCKDDFKLCGSTAPPQGNVDQPLKPPSEATESRGAQLPTSATAEESGYSFILHGCDRSGSSVTCDLTIENKRDERSLEMSRPRVTPASRLVDDLGNEVVAGNKSLGRSVGSSVRLSMPKQVPIKASVNFDGVSPDAKVLRLFEVGCVTGPDYKQFAIQFRNVQLH